MHSRATRERSLEDALDLGITAAGWLRDQVADGDPEASSLFVMLNLRTAIAAARDHNRGTATDLLNRAANAAEQLCGLHWSALDLDAGLLSVQETRVVVDGRAEASDGKSDSAGRLIALDPATVAALRAFHNARVRARVLRSRLHRSRPGLHLAGRPASSS